MTCSEANKPYLIQFGIMATGFAVATAPWVYKLVQSIGKLKKIDVISDCFCKVAAETISPHCQAALDAIYGAGLAPNNITIFCANSGSAHTIKSAAISGIWEYAIGTIVILGVGGFIIGKTIYDCKKQQRSYREIF